MRRKHLVAAALVSTVLGTLLGAVLVLLAPSAAAGSTSESGSSPGNRGWVLDLSGPDNRDRSGDY
jgi:hypothetical protein